MGLTLPKKKFQQNLENANFWKNFMHIIFCEPAKREFAPSWKNIPV